MERLSSDDYSKVAAVVVRKIHDSLSSRRLVSPPFEVHITAGREDNFVLLLSVEQDGKVRGAGADQELVASFPLTVTITDARGNVVEMVIDQLDLQGAHQ